MHVYTTIHLSDELDEERRRVSSLATMRKEMESLQHENKRLSEKLTQKGGVQSDGSRESEARRSSYQYGDSRLSVSTEDGFESVSVRAGIGGCGLSVSHDFLNTVDLNTTMCPGNETAGLIDK